MEKAVLGFQDQEWAPLAWSHFGSTMDSSGVTTLNGTRAFNPAPPTFLFTNQFVKKKKKLKLPSANT